KRIRVHGAVSALWARKPGRPAFLSGLWAAARPALGSRGAAGAAQAGPCARAPSRGGAPAGTGRRSRDLALLPVRRGEPGDGAVLRCVRTPSRGGAAAHGRGTADGGSSSE